MSRPDCVVNVDALPAEKRPRHLPSGFVSSRVRALSKAAGLVRMGVGWREIEPGCASTHRHFHSVEEEWAYVLSGRGAVRIGPHRLEVRAGHFVGPLRRAAARTVSAPLPGDGRRASRDPGGRGAPQR